MLAVLLDGRHAGAIARARQVLPTPLPFYARNHRFVYLACLALDDAGARVDAMAVAVHLEGTRFGSALDELRAIEEAAAAGEMTPARRAEIRARYRLAPDEAVGYDDSAIASLSGPDGLGGFNAVTDLANAYAPVAGFEAALRQVADLAAKRNLILRLSAIVDEAGRTTLDAAELAKRAVAVADSVAVQAPHNALNAAELVANYRSLREPVVRGLLREGEVANVIAPPKAKKSWLVLDLAIAVATGRSWLGMQCEAGPVLIVDNELHREDIAHRLRQVAEARGVAVEQLAASVHVLSLRGRLLDLSALAAELRRLGDLLKPKLIVLDALYRFVPKGTDENSNADATALYNQLDAIAERTGAALVCVHHSSKGNQAEKALTDVGAGAGAMSRAADAHAILRQHEEEACAVLEAACRSWPPLPPLGLRWAHPRWQVDEGLDPAKLAGRPSKAKGRQAPDLGPGEFAARYIGPKPVARDTILGAAAGEGFSNQRAEQLLSMAVDAGLAFAWGKPGRGSPARFATVEPPAEVARSKEQAVLAHLADHPEATTADVAKATGASPAYVRRLKAGDRSPAGAA